VTPSGTPDSTKPRNKGIAEHEQNGVTMPGADAITFPVNVFFHSSALQVCTAHGHVKVINLNIAIIRNCCGRFLVCLGIAGNTNQCDQYGTY
jgi:hypothetical protein